MTGIGRFDVESSDEKTRDQASKIRQFETRVKLAHSFELECATTVFHRLNLSLYL